MCKGARSEEGVCISREASKLLLLAMIHDVTLAGALSTVRVYVEQQQLGQLSDAG